MRLKFLPMITSISYSSTCFAALLLFALSCTSFSTTEAYDALDPTGNITIKWDVMNWTPDGYVAVVTIYNYQAYRHFQALGWSLGWTWAKEEVIWSILGAKATEKGNCSRYKEYIPRYCTKNPTIVDEMPSTPYNEKIPNCCKGGHLGSFVQDQANSIAAFQLSVGEAGIDNRTVRLPKNFTLNAPGYSCGRATIVRPTRFLTADKRRMMKAFMTWNLTCTYSRFLAQRLPTCCVSLSSFYKNSSVPCSTCSCGCQNNTRKCVKPDSSSAVPASDKSYAPLVQCSSHMCPIQISWQVTQNHKQYWIVQLKLTNFNYKMNYSNWNLVIQHPNFEKLIQHFRINYQSLTTTAGRSIYVDPSHISSDSCPSDTAMLWGLNLYNNILMHFSWVSSKCRGRTPFREAWYKFYIIKGWAFPRRVYLPCRPLMHSYIT